MNSVVRHIHNILSLSSSLKQSWKRYPEGQGIEQIECWMVVGHINADPYISINQIQVRV
ncbi:hypothetical protein ACG9YX_00965 [Acinetobacter nematophilus]|uniref:hypothetical protein n=1 Tax=Acinetobacter TaxID=469 RepID=UPI003AF559E6